MGPIETIEHRRFNINIYQDEYAESPRNFLTFGKIICWHRRYSLGDKHDFDDPQDFLDFAESSGDKVFYLPLYLLDHSGISISVHSFNDKWDSGQVGWIYCLESDINREFGVTNEETITKAMELLRQETKTYDDYLTGNVYGYQVEPINSNNKISCDDSCWGYYGREGFEFAVEDAKSNIDHAIKEYCEIVRADVNSKKQVDAFMRDSWAF